MPFCSVNKISDFSLEPWAKQFMGHFHIDTWVGSEHRGDFEGSLSRLDLKSSSVQQSKDRRERVETDKRTQYSFLFYIGNDYSDSRAIITLYSLFIQNAFID